MAPEPIAGHVSIGVRPSSNPLPYGIIEAREGWLCAGKVLFPYTCAPGGVAAPHAVGIFAGLVTGLSCRVPW